MKKKLKIYTALLVVVLIVFGVPFYIHYDEAITSDAKLELVENENDTVSKGVRTEYWQNMGYGAELKKGEGGGKEKMVGIDVLVKPKGQAQRTLLSTSENQTYKIEMQKVRLVVPISKSPLGKYAGILGASLAVAAFIVWIWVFILAFKLIIKIRKGEVFVTQVSRYLEITGFLLTGLYLYNWITSYAITQYYINTIELGDYYIVYRNECNVMYIITGLALMIVSQIILMGKDLKEEQELTI